MNGKKIVNARVIYNRNGELYLDNKPIFIHEGIVVDEDNANCDFEEYNMHGKIIMPGLFNIHSHLGESLYTDVYGDDWTIDAYLKHTDNINKVMSSDERNLFWLKSARITVEQMQRYNTVGYCAARSAGISSEMGILTMSGYPIMNNVKLLEYKKLGIEGFIKYNKKSNSEKCSVGVFLHSVYANDQDSFELAKLCMNNGAEFLTTHVSEDYATMIQEKAMHGMTAIEVLDINGLIGESTILVHCGYVSESDLELIKKRGASICICPISNEFLNTKMVDINKLNEIGIPWFIGTDGLATGKTFSLRDQVNMAKKYYSDIRFVDYFAGITSRPGKKFNRKLYTGAIEIGTMEIGRASCRERV